MSPSARRRFPATWARVPEAPTDRLKRGLPPSSPSPIPIHPATVAATLLLCSWHPSSPPACLNSREPSAHCCRPAADRAPLIGAASFSGPTRLCSRLPPLPPPCLRSRERLLSLAADRPSSIQPQPQEYRDSQPRRSLRLPLSSSTCPERRLPWKYYCSLMEENISTSDLPHREFIKRRRMLLPHEQANLTIDATSSYGVSAPLPAVASAVPKKRKAATTLKTGPSDTASSSSPQSTRRRTLSDQIDATHKQVQIYEQTSRIAMEQIPVPMPDEHSGDFLTGSSVLKRAIASMSCRKHSAETPLDTGAYGEPISGPHANVLQRQAVKKRRMLLPDGTTNSAGATFSYEHTTPGQSIASTSHTKRKAEMGPALHQGNDMNQQLDNYGESARAATSSSARNSTVVQVKRHRRNVTPQIWFY